MRAVVFDLDGTLIDSLPDIAAALNHVLVAEGLAPLGTHEVRVMIGDGAKVLVQRGLAARGVVAAPRHLAAFLRFYEADDEARTVIYPGVLAALEALREAGHPMGVCTNKPEGPARHVLSALGLGRYFRAVAGGDSLAYRKPDPRHLAAVLEALGGGPAVMIGDHENDMAAARGCKVPGIFVRWGYGEAQGDYAADRAEELPGMIAALG